jgi:hypothetical protein
MDDSKQPFASLSPTLLARKGGAKPAMRSQVHYPDALARAVADDDLGWNDMGQDNSPSSPEGAEPEIRHTADVVPFGGALVHGGKTAKPAVLRHQEGLAEQVAQTRKIPVKRRSALDDGRRAAFTLRVDADRHLKLRLACTIRNRSAQQLVTEALDRLLDELPDVATLAAQIAERR